MRSLTVLLALAPLLLLGCERNAHVVVDSRPILLSTPPETPLTSTGALNTTIQNVRESILAVARDLNMTVLREPPAEIEGDAILQPPTGSNIRIHYKEIAPRQIDLTVRRDTAPAGQEIDSLTRRIFTET